MRIAINLLPFTKQIAGAGKYAKYVTHHVIGTDRKNTYILFLTTASAEHFAHLQSYENVRFVFCPFNNGSILQRIAWEQCVLPFQLLFLKIDLLFTPSVAVPVLFPGKKVTSIHDVAYVSNRQKYPLLRRLYVGWITRIAAWQSSSILTLTSFSRAEIVKHLHVASSKIAVTYCGVDDIYFHSASDERKSSVRILYGLPEKFILYVGAVEPGKNLNSVFQAFLHVHRRVDHPISLVLTGGVGWKKESIIQQIPSDIRDMVKILPYLTEEELPVLYQLSEVLLYISAYEGFGLPVLEAMASGTPVVTSFGTAINEFATDAAMLVDPQNVPLISEALEQILSDPSLRQQLITAGKERATQYSWLATSMVVLNELQQYEHA